MSDQIHSLLTPPNCAVIFIENRAPIQCGWANANYRGRSGQRSQLS